MSIQETPLELHASGKQSFQPTNIFLMIFLTVVTLWIYIPYWFLKNYDYLKSLDENGKLSKIGIYFALIIYIAWFFMALVYAVVEWTPYEPLVDKIQYIISITGSLSILVLSFQARKIINNWFHTKISGFLTFLFWMYYLEYKLQKLNKVS